MSAASHDTNPKTVIYPPKEPQMLIPDSKPLNDYDEAELREAGTKCYNGGRGGGKAFKPTASQQAAMGDAGAKLIQRPRDQGNKLTPAQSAMRNLLNGIAALPAWEQAEVAEVKEILDRLVLRYGSSAHLAMMGVCINTSIDKGE